MMKLWYCVDLRHVKKELIYLQTKVRGGVLVCVEFDPLIENMRRFCGHFLLPSGYIKRWSLELVLVLLDRKSDEDEAL